MNVLISQTDASSYELICDNKTIQVFNGSSFMAVYVGTGCGVGQVFHQDTVADRLAAAVSAYKAAAVKSALQSLADFLA